MTTLIAGATPISSPQPRPVDVVIDDGRITRVGPAEPGDPAARRGFEVVIDGRDRLMIPGLRNAHLHSHDRFDRGRADNLPLEVWRAWYNPPGPSREWTPEETYLRTLISGAELLAGGTTAVIDDVHLGASLNEQNIAAVFRAYRDLGIRATVSIAYSDLPFYADLPYAECLLPAEFRSTPDDVGRRQEILDLWRSLASMHTGAVNFALSPSAPLRCSRQFLEDVAVMSADLDLPVLLHLLETSVQIRASTGQGISRLVDYVRNVGLLTERTYLFHAVWADQSDVETIASSRARVVHCPGSNMKLGSGIAPVKRLLEAGAPVSLGSDNFSANDAASMFEQMKLACLLSRVGGEAPDSWITAHDAYAMAIGGQTSALSAEDLFAPGKPADLVLLRKTARCFQPENNLVRQLVFAADASTVETVLVSGRIVLDQGRFTTIDEQGLYAELQHRLPAIRAKLERSEVVGNQLRPILAAAFQRATTSPNPPGPCR